MKSISRLFPAIMVMFLYACDKNSRDVPEPVTERDYTVMFYAVSEGSLSEPLTTTYNDLAVLNSTDKVAMTGQFKFGRDIQESKEPQAQAFKGVQRFTLPEKGAEFKPEVIGDASMPFSYTEPLRDFIKWSADKYPAKNYILILWGHGEGWSYVTDSGTKGCLIDDNIDNSGRFMTNDELVNAVQQSGIHLKVLDFYCCNMGRMEALCEFAKIADYTRVSNEAITGNGTETGALVKYILEEAEKKDDVESFVSNVWKSYLDYTLTSCEDAIPNIPVSLAFVDLRRLPPVLSSVKKMSELLVKEYSGHKAAFDKAARSCYLCNHGVEPKDSFEYDILDYLFCLSEAVKEEGEPSKALYDKLTGLYAEMKSNFDYCELYRVENANEVKMFPFKLSQGVLIMDKNTYSSIHKPVYEKLAFNELTSWGKWLETNEIRPSGNPSPFNDLFLADDPYLGDWERNISEDEVLHLHFWADVLDNGSIYIRYDDYTYNPAQPEKKIRVRTGDFTGVRGESEKTDPNERILFIEKVDGKDFECRDILVPVLKLSDRKTYMELRHVEAEGYGDSGVAGIYKRL